MQTIEIFNITGMDYDELVSEFPGIEKHAKVLPNAEDGLEDQEMGTIMVVIDLAPEILQFGAALLTFLAARYQFKKKDQE